MILHLSLSALTNYQNDEQLCPRYDQSSRLFWNIDKRSVIFDDR